MKKFRILMGALALAVAAATIVACNKEKESNAIQQTVEETGRKPIATLDNATGQMTYHFDMIELQQKLNEVAETKNDQDRFIIESIQVIDSLPLNQSELPEIKVTILDVEDETTFTMWLMQSFTEKVVLQSTTRYYADAGVNTGVYEFGFQDEGKFYKVSVNGDEYDITEIDSPTCLGFMPRWLLWCRRDNCANECTKGGSWINSHCNPCNDGQGGRCLEDFSPWFSLGSSAVSAFKLIRLLFA